MLVWILIDWLGARIQAYKDFYANYDAEKDFQRMKVIHAILILPFSNFRGI